MTIEETPRCRFKDLSLICDSIILWAEILVRDSITKTNISIE